MSNQSQNPNERVHALLEAHQYVSEEIGEARAHAMANDEMNDEFRQGHINGLQEASNRVQQAILEFANGSDTQ